MTHDELPGDDWGGDTSPRPGMRERELANDITYQIHNNQKNIKMNQNNEICLK